MCWSNVPAYRHPPPLQYVQSVLLAHMLRECKQKELKVQAISLKAEKNVKVKYAVKPFVVLSMNQIARSDFAFACMKQHARNQLRSDSKRL